MIQQAYEYASSSLWHHLMFSRWCVSFRTISLPSFNWSVMQIGQDSSINKYTAYNIEYMSI